MARVQFGEGGDQSLGRIVTNDGNFEAQLSWEDLLWAARMLLGEGASEGGLHGKAILWCMTNRIVLSNRAQGRKSGGAYKRLIKQYSQPINPKWREEAVTGDTDAEISVLNDICRDPSNEDVRNRCSIDQKRRRVVISTKTWNELPENVTDLVVKWARGEVNNPVVGAVHFALNGVGLTDSPDYKFIWNSAGLSEGDPARRGNTFIAGKRNAYGLPPTENWTTDYVQIIGPNNTAIGTTLDQSEQESSTSREESQVVSPLPESEEERNKAITQGRTEPPSDVRYPYFILSGSDPQTKNIFPLPEVIRSPWEKFYDQITSYKELTTLELNSVVPILKIEATDENNNIVNLNKLIFTQSPVENFSEEIEFEYQNPERPIASLRGLKISVQSPSVGGPTGIMVGTLMLSVHNSKAINKNHPKGKFIHWMLKQNYYIRITYGLKSLYTSNPAVKSIEQDFFVAQHKLVMKQDLTFDIDLTIIPAHTKLFNSILVGENIPATSLDDRNLQNIVQSVLDEDATSEQYSQLKDRLMRFRNQWNSRVRTIGTNTEIREDNTLGMVLHGALANDEIIRRPDGFDPIIVRNYIEALQLLQSSFLTSRLEQALRQNAYRAVIKPGLEINAINIGALFEKMIRPEVDNIAQVVARTGFRIGDVDAGQEVSNRTKVKIIYGNFNSNAGNWAEKPISVFPIDWEIIMNYIREEREVGNFSSTLNSFIGRISTIVSNRDYYIATSKIEDGQTIASLEIPQIKYIFYADPSDNESWIMYIYDNKELIVNISNLLHDLRKQNENFLTKEQIKEKCNQYKIPWIELGSNNSLIKRLGAQTDADDMIMSHNIYQSNLAFGQRSIDGAPLIPPGISANFLAGTTTNPQDIIRASDLIMPIHMNLGHWLACDSVLFGHFYIFFPIEQFSGLYSTYEITHNIENGNASTDFTLQINITDRNRTA